MPYAVAVDIGGTFTDLVAYDHEGGNVLYAKSPTTYGNFVDRHDRVVRSGVSMKLDVAPAGTHYAGVPMPYFCRFTASGFGIHAGTLPGYPAGHTEDQAWWCGYGPVEDPTIVVCAVIENGGHGGAVAAPAALQVFEQYFGLRPGQQTTVASD